MKYFDGLSWTNYSNYKHFKFEPKLDLQKIILSFDKKRHGKYLEFDGNKNSVKCIKHDNLYHTALFGIEIKKSICNLFKIKFKIVKYGKYQNSSDFFIGFTTLIARESMKNYNQAIGCGLNKKQSIGIRICGNDLFLYDQNNVKTKINYDITSDRFKINETFKFIFNFNNNTWILCHDLKQIYKSKLNTNCIIPAVTLGNQDEEIQVLSWEFQ